MRVCRGAPGVGEGIEWAHLDFEPEVLLRVHAGRAVEAPVPTSSVMIRTVQMQVSRGTPVAGKGLRGPTWI